MKKWLVMEHLTYMTSHKLCCNDHRGILLVFFHLYWLSCYCTSYFLFRPISGISKYHMHLWFCLFQCFFLNQIGWLNREILFFFFQWINWLKYWYHISSPILFVWIYRVFLPLLVCGMNFVFQCWGTDWKGLEMRGSLLGLNPWYDIPDTWSLDIWAIIINMGTNEDCSALTTATWSISSTDQYSLGVKL